MVLARGRLKGVWVEAIFAAVLLLGLIVFLAARGGSPRVRFRRHDRVREFRLGMPNGERPALKVEVASGSGSGESYEVDLRSLTCTCPDFARRKREPEDSLSRCCKHLLSELSSRGLFQECDKWTRAVVESGFGAPMASWLINLDTAPEVLATASSDSNWLNVFAHGKRKGERIREASGGIERFGWSVEEKRWSYGDGPPGAGELRKILKQVV